MLNILVSYDVLNNLVSYNVLRFRVCYHAGGQRRKRVRVQHSMHDGARMTEECWSIYVGY
jgi:hypothetical protein